MPDYRYPEFTKAMNEHFDHSDRETVKVLLAVNEEDQSRVLTALTSKLYDSVVDKVDDIDFAEIPATKGDITKLPTYERTIETAETIQQILHRYNQSTEKNIDQVLKGIENVAQKRDLFIKGYALNKELPIVLYNTMVMDIVMSLSYMISNCIDFIKTPGTDAFDTIVDRNAILKTQHHLLFENLKKFNDSCSSGELDKALEYVLKSDGKNFLGGSFAIGGVVVAVGIVLNIIPIMRELIYFYFYNRVRMSDYFALQADLLQMNAYNVEHNRPGISKEERDKIVRKQTTIAKTFRTVSDKISIDCKQSEAHATKAIVADTKKFKTSEIMDEIPDSAASSIF